MEYGTNTSGHQDQMLKLALRRYTRPADIIQYLQQLARDEDILEGEEQVNPEWEGVYKRVRPYLDRSLHASEVETIEQFFSGLRPYDPRLSNLDPRELRITFLLGAGASKPEPSNIPTVKELLPQLLNRARRLDRDDVTRLATFCKQRRIDNIEDLLTAAHIATFCSRQPTVLRLLNYLLYGEGGERRANERNFGGARSHRGGARPAPSSADPSSVAFLQETLQILFGLLSSTMLPADPNRAHEAIASYVKAHPEAAIVTTNYDCCMDVALTKVGQPYEYRIPFRDSSDSVVAGHDAAAKVIKLHGSLNWYYCETCQNVQLVDVDLMLKLYNNDQTPYPVIGICKKCDGQRRGLLLPPLAMKFDLAPSLTPLLDQAKACFDEAEVVVVVGFSFAEADVYISRMLSKSMQMNPNQQALVVDPDRSVADKVRRKFEASIPNFERERIIRLSGDCGEVLPQFLSGEFYAPRPEETTAEAEETTTG
ncbi:MAG: SIR2 family protein [Phycisphaeraceae bacterium]